MRHPLKTGAALLLSFLFLSPLSSGSSLCEKVLASTQRTHPQKEDFGATTWRGVDRNTGSEIVFRIAKDLKWSYQESSGQKTETYEGDGLIVDTLFSGPPSKNNGFVITGTKDGQIALFPLAIVKKGQRTQLVYSEITLVKDPSVQDFISTTWQGFDPSANADVVFRIGSDSKWSYIATFRDTKRSKTFEGDRFIVDTLFKGPPSKENGFVIMPTKNGEPAVILALVEDGPHFKLVYDKMTLTRQP